LESVKSSQFAEEVSTTPLFALDVSADEPFLDEPTPTLPHEATDVPIRFKFSSPL
jgi:hypothetical protein